MAVKTATQSDGIDLYKMTLGGSNGPKTYNMVCPGNGILTGLTMGVGNGMIGSPKSMICANPGDLYSTTRTVVNNPVTTGGTPSVLNCPTGSGISNITASWDNGYVVRYLQATCNDVTGKSVSNIGWGNPNVKTNLVQNTNPMLYISSLDGNYGSYLDKMNITFKDISKGLNVYNTDVGKRQACNNELPQGFNTMTKDQCDIFMKQSCLNNGEPRCACYNSQIIKDFQKQDPMFPSCPHVYDSVCQSSGYKSEALKNIKDCSYLNCSVNILAGANVANTDIKQMCSSTKNTLTPDAAGGTTPSTTPSTNPNTAPSATTDSVTDFMNENSNILIMLLVVIFLVFGLYSVKNFKNSASNNPRA